MGGKIMPLYHQNKLHYMDVISDFVLSLSIGIHGHSRLSIMIYGTNMEMEWRRKSLRLRH